MDPAEEYRSSVDPLPTDESQRSEADAQPTDVEWEWERHARWWQTNFTQGSDPEYSELIIPMILDHIRSAGTPGGVDEPTPTRNRRMLDVGAGEGQVSRAVADLGNWDVDACDFSWTQLSEARRRGGDPSYLAGSVTDLPVRSGSVDAVVACLVLEHVGDLAGALGEVARVLRPGAHLVVVLNHPIVSTPGSGWVDDHIVDPPEQYWQLGAYLPAREVHETVADGVTLTFFHRPLSSYLNTARSLGMALVSMEEPPPPPGFIALDPAYTEQLTMPRMVMLDFERL